MGLYVNDAEKFPQDTPMQIWIGGERIDGQFNGNFFSVSERGAAVYTGAVTALGADCQQIVDTSLAGAGRDLRRLLRPRHHAGRQDAAEDHPRLRFVHAHAQLRHAGRLDGHELFQPDADHLARRPFLDSGSAYTLPIGATYQIASNVATHPAGVEGLRRALELHLRGQ